MTDTLALHRADDAQRPAPVADEARAFLRRLGVSPAIWTDGDLVARSPITGEAIGGLTSPTATEA